MALTSGLMLLAIVAAAWGTITSILIFESLRRSGERVSFLWLRLMLPAFVHRYAKLTRAENGRAGPLFYHFVVAFNLALAAVILALLLR